MQLATLLLALFGSEIAFAAGPTPTPEQIQMFQQLPQAQRDALLKRYQAGSSTSTISSPSKPPEFAEVSKPAQEAAQPIDQKPVIRGSDTLLLDFELLPPSTRTPGDKAEPERASVHSQLLAQKLYTLDKTGVLDLPNVGRIPLSGLNEQEAAARIMAEPLLQELRVSVKRLPVEEELKPFGYDLFSATPAAFAPSSDIPVSADYVVGPGDVVVVQLFGKDNGLHELPVTREGTILFPGIGPMSVAGLKFSRLQDMIAKRAQAQFIGMKASVTLGKLRSIQIFVLGDVERPGSYMVSGLTTITNALLMSGGVKKVGSLRNVELKRGGKTIVKFDLYDLLLKGDNSNDKNLLPNDVVFVPPLQTTVGIAGEVQRPAIYELKTERTLAELIGLAGGFSSKAYLKTVQIKRIQDNRDRTMETVDLTQVDPARVQLVNGDIVRIPYVLDKMEGVVMLSGHVYRPGNYQWRPNMRLADIVPSVEAMLPKPDLDYALIRREIGPDRRAKMLSARLGKAIAERESTENVQLQPRDQIFVFALTGDRQAQINPVLNELTTQSDSQNPLPIVSINGLVRDGGQYPLEEGMRLADLIRAAGGMREAAYTLGAEITRYGVVNGEYREIAHIPVNLTAALAGDEKENQLLQSHDHLQVKQLPQWSEQYNVEIRGEVRFPGTYAIKRGETINDLVQRAGGLTNFAFPEGAVFMREELQRKEQDQIDTLARRLEADIAAISLEQMQSNVEKQQAAVSAKSLLADLKNTKAVGRLVIDLNRIMRDPTDNPVVLKDGDKLVIPQQQQEVTVAGEVHYPTSHVYQSGTSRDGYINKSGGITYKGDKGRIYVVRANGSVDASNGRWFSTSQKIRTGDTIVVPLDVERMRPLTLWSNISQIVYQIGVAAAAWHTIGVF